MSADQNGTKIEGVSYAKELARTFDEKKSCDEMRKAAKKHGYPGFAEPEPQENTTEQPSGDQPS